jgi:DHA3 family tetracycline resistance protein-like MFS transporter
MRVLRPFRSRDFLFLWAGTQVSFLGDGIYFVAIAWEVYRLSNNPAALSLVGVAWTIPHVGALLIGGAVSDRMERRRVMLASNLFSGLAIGTIAVLVLMGEVRLWQIWALVAVYGASAAFFVPAASAILPEIVPRELLLEANSLQSFVRPLTLRLFGPAVGGVLVAGVGPGSAFVADAGTFVFAAATLLFVRKRVRERPADAEGQTSLLNEVADGFRFVRSQRWLWVSLLAAGLWLFVTIGPIEVLIPFLVKNRIGASAAGLGLVFAAGGAGAFACSLGLALYGRTPRRGLAFVYLAWAGSTFGVAALALGVEVWQAMLASVFLYGLSAAGGIVWQTLLQRRVPGDMLGRVSSLDWFASAGLVPVSFAVTGPIASSLGASTTLFSAGIIGACLMLLCLLVPDLRAEEAPPQTEPAVP